MNPAIARALLLAIPIAACSGAPADDPPDTSAQSAAQSTAQSPPSATAQQPRLSADAWLPGMLGPAVVIADDRSRNTFRADFDADGHRDLLVIVRATGSAGGLPVGVRLVRPWPTDDDVTPSDDLTQGAAIALAVIHGAADPNDARAFLLHDPNPVSILDTQAATELHVLPRGELEALDEPDLAARARGDVIVVPTEAGIDTYIFWDGSTYRTFEPLDVP